MRKGLANGCTIAPVMGTNKVHVLGPTCTLKYTSKVHLYFKVHLKVYFKVQMGSTIVLFCTLTGAMLHSLAFPYEKENGKLQPVQFLAELSRSCVLDLTGN